MARFRLRLFAMAAFAAVLTTLGAAAPAGAADQPVTIAQAQAQLDSATARLTQLNDQVERAQARLDAANRQLDQDATTQAHLDRQLGEMARYQYTQPALPVRIFRAGTLADAFGEIAQARIIGNRQEALLEQQKATRQRDQVARDGIVKDLAAIQAAQDQAKQVAQQAQQALQGAQAEAQRQQAALLAQQAQATAGGVHPAVVSGGSYPNHFTYGYCTWYVANRRPIPWYGNAIEWWPNARAYGYAEGSAPAVGAVMVTRESSTGHVAYVESVNGDGSWTVSEMNYVAWGTVSRRTLRPGQTSVVGFIYGN